MKLYITSEEYEALSSDVKQFISTWKKRKYPAITTPLSIGELMELLIATTYNLHYESSDGRFFNKVLTNAESLVAWEGQELIDILLYEVDQAIKKLLHSSGTFNSEEQTAT